MEKNSFHCPMSADLPISSGFMAAGHTRHWTDRPRPAQAVQSWTSTHSGDTKGSEIADSPQFWSTNGWWNVDGIFMKCWWNIHEMVMECGWNVGEMLVNMRSLPWFTMVYHWKIAAAARYQASLSLAAASVQLHLQWSGSHPRRRESWCGGIFGLAEMLIEFFQVPLCNMAPFEVDGFIFFNFQKFLFGFSIRIFPLFIRFSEVFVWTFLNNMFPFPKFSQQVTSARLPESHGGPDQHWGPGMDLCIGLQWGGTGDSASDLGKCFANKMFDGRKIWRIYYVNICFIVIRVKTDPAVCHLCSVVNSTSFAGKNIDCRQLQPATSMRTAWRSSRCSDLGFDDVMCQKPPSFFPQNQWTWDKQVSNQSFFGHGNCEIHWISSQRHWSLAPQVGMFAHRSLRHAWCGHLRTVGHALAAEKGTETGRFTSGWS